MNWKDTTSYSRGQVNIIPSCWTLKTQHVTIDVLNGHIHFPGEWVMHCHSIGINKKRIGIVGQMTEEQAKETAIQIVKHVLNMMLTELNELNPE